MTEGLGFSFDLHLAKAPRFIFEGPLQERDEIVSRNGLELENLRAGDKGGVDVKVGIVSGGANKANGASLKVGKKGVLLGLVEAVDFVDEEDGGLVTERLVSAGGLNLCPDLGNI